MIPPEQLSLVTDRGNTEVMNLTEEHFSFVLIQNSLVGVTLSESIFESTRPIDSCRDLLTTAALNPTISQL
jgi:hypothetical protein